MNSKKFFIKFKDKKICIDTNSSQISAVKNTILSKEYSSNYSLFMNTHMFVSCIESKELLNVVNHAEYIFADGKPIYLLRKVFGCKNTVHIRGMDFTKEILKFCEDKDIKVGFLGSSNETIGAIKKNLKQRFPMLKIVYMRSPPFSDLDALQIKTISEEINNSNTKCLFVGMGCPKQEILIGKLQSFVTCNMFAVGAVFDFIAGNKNEAPIIIQKLGMEWLFRMISDFRRLFKRYLKYNFKFLILCLNLLFIHILEKVK